MIERVSKRVLERAKQRRIPAAAPRRIELYLPDLFLMHAKAALEPRGIERGGLKARAAHHGYAVGVQSLAKRLRGSDQRAAVSFRKTGRSRPPVTPYQRRESHP